MITWEELQRMNVPSIRTVVPEKPKQKELAGAKFKIDALVGKEIYVIDWLYIDHSQINKEREMIKLQFYYNAILGVVFTTADDIITSVKEWQKAHNEVITPFKDVIVKDGMSYRFNGLEAFNNSGNSGNNVLTFPKIGESTNGTTDNTNTGLHFPTIN